MVQKHFSWTVFLIAALFLLWVALTSRPPQATMVAPVVPAPVELAISSPTVPNEALRAARITQFESYTGIRSPALNTAYLAADLNRSGSLSYYEIMCFQEALVVHFRYESNRFALRPDQFLATKGGDCEDFSLYTAGLLRFYGWEPYIGALYDGKSPTGHAICLVYERRTVPAELRSYTVREGSEPPGMKAGKYVPIDYGVVGGLSDKDPSVWMLQSAYVPEAMWGKEL